MQATTITATPPPTPTAASTSTTTTTPYHHHDPQDPGMNTMPQDQPHEQRELLPADEQELLSRIRAQVDFYFSPQNLCKDHFLCSLLHSYEHYGAVPVSTICSFPKIRQLVASAYAGRVVLAEQAPPADPALLYRAVQNTSFWVRVVGDAVTGYWFVPMTLPDQSWLEESTTAGAYSTGNHQQYQYHDPMMATASTNTTTNTNTTNTTTNTTTPRMVSGPPPPPPPPPLTKKAPATLNTTAATAATSSSTTASSSSPTSFTTGTSDTCSQGTFPPTQTSMMERTVVLVHGIPDAHAENNVCQLFSGTTGGTGSSYSDDQHHSHAQVQFSPKSVVQDAGRTWHVTFGTEQEARAALLASADKMYRGMPIHAGLKNQHEHFNNNNNAAAAAMQYSYPPQQQQSYWQTVPAGNGQGESQYYMAMPAPQAHGMTMLYGNVQQQRQHQQQHQYPAQYSYGYAVVPPLIMSSPPQQQQQQQQQQRRVVVVPGMYAGPVPPPLPHQIGYAVPAAFCDYGAVAVTPPPATPPPPLQVFVHSSQRQHQPLDVEGDVVDQDERVVETKSSQDTAVSSQKSGPRSKKGYNNNKGGNRSNQNWSGDSRKDANASQQQQAKKVYNNAHKHKKKGKQQRDSADPSRNLTQEHFPALAGSSKNTQNVHKPKKAAYAEALLKPPTRSAPSGEPTGQTRTTQTHDVVRQMKGLGISIAAEQGASQKSSEQKASRS